MQDLNVTLVQADLARLSGELDMVHPHSGLVILPAGEEGDILKWLNKSSFQFVTPFL
jgi:hypothetical protein